MGVVVVVGVVVVHGGRSVDASITRYYTSGRTLERGFTCLKVQSSPVLNELHLRRERSISRLRGARRAGRGGSRHRWTERTTVVTPPHEDAKPFSALIRGLEPQAW
nr:hypothetical protein CFP56_72533 [Quercus suber]